MQTCCLCRVEGPGEDGQGDFLRPRTVAGKRVYVHEYCALFSPKVYEDETGSLVNVGSEIHRGNALVRGWQLCGSRCVCARHADVAWGASLAALRPLWSPGRHHRLRCKGV